MTKDEAISTLRNVAWLGTDKKVGQVEEALQMAITALQTDRDCISRSEVLDIIDCLNDPDWYDYWYEEAKRRVNGLPSIQPTQPNTPNTLQTLDCIDRQAAIDTAAEYEKELREILGDENELVEVVKILKHRLIALPSVQPETTARKFEGIVVEYPHPDLCTYPEYKGKPYFSIKYTENGECFVGFGTYKPEVLSDYLKTYFFISSAQPEPCEDAISRREAIRIASGYCHPANVAKELAKLPSVQPEVIRCKDCRYYKEVTSIHGDCESADMWSSLFGEVTEVEAIEVHKDHYCGYAERRTDERDKT